MKKYIIISALVMAIISIMSGCKKNDFPVDEDGLLITTRTDCYVSNFELLGPDFQTVRSKAPVIDTTALTISQEVLYGTDLRSVWPQFSLAQDCKLDPKVTGKTDFSDLANPRQYTVISGNRQIRKTYKVIITVQSR